MDQSFKPENYNSVSPYFIIADGQKFVNMLKHVFSATEKRRYDNPDGSIMHCEMLLDDSILMLGGASEKYPAIQLFMHVYVADADLIYQKAIEYGCTSVDAPKQQEGDPDRRGTFKDFAGNTWSVGTQM